MVSAVVKKSVTGLTSLTRQIAELQRSSAASLVYRSVQLKFQPPSRWLGFNQSSAFLDVRTLAESLFQAINREKESLDRADFI